MDLHTSGGLCNGIVSSRSFHRCGGNIGARPGKRQHHELGYLVRVEHAVVIERQAKTNQTPLHEHEHMGNRHTRIDSSQAFDGFLRVH